MDSRSAYYRVYRADVRRNGPRTVSSLGAKRRVEALACNGWSTPRLAALAGHGEQWIKQALLNERISRTTHVEIKRLFERLWKIEAPARTKAERYSVARAKVTAERNGWAPPEAWVGLDIESPLAQPRTRRLRAPVPVAA